jgi:hypothetical protein
MDSSVKTDKLKPFIEYHRTLLECRRMKLSMKKVADAAHNKAVKAATLAAEDAYLDSLHRYNKRADADETIESAYADARDAYEYAFARTHQCVFDEEMQHPMIKAMCIRYK